ncbi:MAG: hypothetical protein ABWZ25_08320 [Chitinophagaceae bacterium]
MYLLTRFFFVSDLLFVPICLILLFAIIRFKAKKQPDHICRLYYKAFFYKTFFVFAFTLITEYYFKGGDTGLYYQGVTDLRNSVKDNFGHISDILFSLKLTSNSPLFPYFFYDNYVDDITANYMISPSNFFIPRLALIPSFLFNNSFLCINLCFSFFALGGAIRLFKTFNHFFPDYWKEIALATLFLPDVCYWSGGLLKDPICFGAIGFITYGILNIFIKKEKVFSSILLILICCYLLFFIKIYILLVLMISIILWQFAEFNKLIKDVAYRRLFSFLSFAGSLLVAFLLVTYLTSSEGGQAYRIDRIMEQSSNQRRQFGLLAEQQGGSYFAVNNDNVFTLVFNGIIATFFRPFPWEISSPIMLFSAIEALILLILTGFFVLKRGFLNFFRFSFKDPRTLMCFSFAMIFAVAVGSTTSNFGAMSRYKIPCMPFYLLLLLLLYRNSRLAYPGWFQRILILVSK